MFDLPIPPNKKPLVTKQRNCNWVIKPFVGAIKKLWRQVINVLFGYDFFISYAWDDGRNYAIKLVETLENHNFECFLDSKDYAKGYDWKIVGELALRRTHCLILVGSDNALKSPAVLHELTIFNKRSCHIIPITFGESLDLNSIPLQVRSLLPDTMLRIKEHGESLAVGPSIETVDDLTNSFDVLTQQQKRIRIFAIATIVFALVAASAIWFWNEAVDQLHSTQVEQARFRASKSTELLDQGLASQALMLAVSAVPGPHDLNRVLEPSALGAVMRAAIALRERNVFRHEKDIELLAVSSDDSLLLSIDKNGGMFVWDTITGLSKWNSTDNKDFPNSITFSHNSALLAVAFDGGGIDIRRTVDGKRVGFLPEISGKSAHLLFSLDDSWIASAHSNGHVIVMSLPNGQILRELDLHGEEGWRIALSSDGELLAAGTDTGMIRIWRTKDWTELEIIEDLVGKETDTGIYSLDFSENSKLLLAAGFSDRALLWNKESREKKLFNGIDSIIDGFHFAPHDSKFLLHFKKERPFNETHIRDVANPTWFQHLRYSGNLESAVWSSDGTRVTTLTTLSDKLKLSIWNSNNGNLVDSVAWEIPVNLQSVTTGLAVAHDSNTAFVINGKDIYQIYIGTRAEIRDVAKYTGDGTPIDDLLVSTDGHKIAFSDENDLISVWDRTNSSTPAVQMQDCRSMHEFGFSTDGTRIVSGSENGTILICDVESGGTIESSTGVYSKIRRARFLPNDRRVIAEAHLSVTDRPSEHHSLVVVWNKQSGADVQLQNCPSRGSKITSGRFTLNGNRIITWCHPQDEIQVYDTNSLKLIGKIPKRESKLSLSLNASMLAYSSGTDGKPGAVWDLHSVSHLLALPPPPIHEGKDAVYGTNMSANGKYVMAFTPLNHRKNKRGKVTVWEVETGKVKAILENVDTSCRNHTFIASDEWIAFECEGTFDIYDATTGGFLATFPVSNDEYSDIVITPDRRGIFVASTNGDIRYINLWESRQDLIVWTIKQLKKIKPMDDKTCNSRRITDKVCRALQE